MENGIIELDTDRGRLLGFTSDLFTEGSYLWKEDSAVMISFIESKAKGNFRALVGRILAKGWSVKVPTPLPRMERIVKKNGYRHTIELGEETGEPCHVWVLDPA